MRFMSLAASLKEINSSHDDRRKLRVPEKGGSLRIEFMGEHVGDGYSMPS
jgi:hypothetical protein